MEEDRGYTWSIPIRPSPCQVAHLTLPRRLLTPAEWKLIMEWLELVRPALVDYKPIVVRKKAKV